MELFYFLNLIQCKCCCWGEKAARNLVHVVFKNKWAAYCLDLFRNPRLISLVSQLVRSNNKALIHIWGQGLKLQLHQQMSETLVTVTAARSEKSAAVICEKDSEVNRPGCRSTITAIVLVPEKHQTTGNYGNGHTRAIVGKHVNCECTRACVLWTIHGSELFTLTQHRGGKR